jgi:hypothetical protein
MQSLSNAAFFHGVCEESFDREIHVEITAKRTPTQGEFLYVEGEIGAQIHSFIGLTIDQQANSLRIGLTSGVTVRENQTNGRILLREVVGKIMTDYGQQAVEVCDGSETGLGFNFFAPLERGSTIQINLDTVCGAVDLLGKVMNCRCVRYDQESYRVGVQIVGMDRISQARWKRVLMLES